MRERCCRCHITLTSEDKYHYSISCEQCECDIEWENHERDNPIKSAYWRWRAICFCLRWLRGEPVTAGNLCMRYLRCRLDERRKLQHVRRGR